MKVLKQIWVVFAAAFVIVGLIIWLGLHKLAGLFPRLVNRRTARRLVEWMAYFTPEDGEWGDVVYTTTSFDIAVDRFAVSIPATEVSIWQEPEPGTVEYRWQYLSANPLEAYLWRCTAKREAPREEFLTSFPAGLVAYGQKIA
jgi:hypothetical protein